MTKARLMELLSTVPDDAVLDAEALKQGRLIFTAAECTATVNGQKVRV